MTKMTSNPVSHHDKKGGLILCVPPQEGPRWPRPPRPTSGMTKLASSPHVPLRGRPRWLQPPTSHHENKGVPVPYVPPREPRWLHSLCPTTRTKPASSLVSHHKKHQGGSIPHIPPRGQHRWLHLPMSHHKAEDELVPHVPPQEGPKWPRPPPSHLEEEDGLIACPTVKKTQGPSSPRTPPQRGARCRCPPKSHRTDESGFVPYVPPQG